MTQNSPALVANRQLKAFLFSRHEITKMIRKKSFQQARQLLPQKLIIKAADQLGLNYKVKKLQFHKLFKGIFYSIVVKGNSSSRAIASSGKTTPGKLFTRLESVSHTAVLNRLHGYDESKLDALIVQILHGIHGGTYFHSKSASKVQIVDTTSLTLSLSRVHDELPVTGSKKPSPSSKLGAGDDKELIETKGKKGLLKLGIVSAAGSFTPLNYQFSTDYDDNQIFRDLIDWSKKGYTWLIDRGNISVNFLRKFSDHDMYFIQKTYKKHTFDKLWVKKLPTTSRVLGRFDLKREIRGWILNNDGIKVKVRRIEAYDEKNKELLSLTTNDLTSHPRVIVKRHAHRWEIEVLINWLKNTLGPDDDHKLSQWTRVKALRNLIRIWIIILALLLAYSQKKFGTKWWKPQRFSLGDVISCYEDQLIKWLEGKLGIRHRTLDVRR